MLLSTLSRAVAGEMGFGRFPQVNAVVVDGAQTFRAVQDDIWTGGTGAEGLGSVSSAV